MPDPQLIQVKKYPNRRLYDSTRSRHLTHEELYELVVAGHTVRVTDSKSAADITNLVLLQALMEHSPEKFGSFPPEVSHLMIRASEQVLRNLSNSWFTQLFKNLGGAAASSPSPFGWPVSMGFPWTTTGAPASGAAAPPPAPEPDAVADLEARLEAMRRELGELKASRRKPT